MNAPVVTRDAATGKVALLNISGLCLAVPQAEIRAVEPLSAVDAVDAEPLSVGWIRQARQRWPVYCLSQQLSLLDAVPAERRSCVLLGSGADCMGILCDEVGIEQIAEPSHELPAAMHLPHTPVLGLVALGERQVACLTSAERLAVHIARLGGM